MNETLFSDKSPRQRGGGSWLLPLGLLIAFFFCAAMWLLPSLTHPRWVSYRMQSSYCLKDIGLAMHNYHDTYDEFPPAYTVDKHGKPLLSWRVLLLPFMEEEELYEKFHLDEPWSSAANRELISQMPEIYTSPFFRDSRKEGKTPYLAIVDEHDGHTVLLPKKSCSFKDIIDGSSNSAIAIDDPAYLVTWTKPDDWDPLELLVLSSFGENEMHGIHVLLADGSLTTIDQKNRERLVGMIYCDDGRIPLD